jgi:hypothetical protein
MRPDRRYALLTAYGFHHETYEKTGSEWKLKTMRVSSLRADGAWLVLASGNWLRGCLRGFDLNSGAPAGFGQLHDLSNTLLMPKDVLQTFGTSPNYATA